MAKRSASKGTGGLGLWLGLSALVILLDQLSKIAVLRTFAYGEARPVTDFFNLVLVYNRGAAFSFLAQAGGWQRWLFTAIGIVATVFIVWLMKRHAGQRMFCLALALIMGGALGNVIDRVAYGHVIDFLDFYAGRYHWPAFNLADSAIFLGAALLIVDEIRRVRRQS
ncbi:lipoprotein signal peptidase [Imbroritus primus]|uniref:Lipoprotein signal peptidase n=1 Tax=Imbroritus primus TaxID=3058603 RepID=A0ACD3SK74_9BURK|nr:lipoprotein signal peptidase [Burkholderiaceae bacterium PBA]